MKKDERININEFNEKLTRALEKFKKPVLCKYCPPGDKYDAGDALDPQMDLKRHIMSHHEKDWKRILGGLKNSASKEFWHTRSLKS